MSAESVPSLISNLTFALYGQIQKDVSNGKVVWIIPCDPNNTAFIGDVPRQPGEGLMCYFIRYFNTVYPGGVLGIEYGGTGASTAQAALSNLGGVPATRQVITAPSSGLSGGGTLAADRSLSIANTTVVPGTYGANNRIPVLTVNARGQLTGATTVAAEGFASVDGEVITANISQQTVFNLTSIVYSPGTDNLAVYRNGLRLLVGQDYIETNSTTVTLTRGVAIGNQLLFESGRIIGQDVSSVAVATQRIVAADPAPGIQQTVFNLTAITYVPGNNSLAVYRNGLKLDVGADYIETNSATVTLTAGAAAGDQFTFEAGKMLSQPVSATVQTQTITSSLGQTVFALTLSYTPNIGNLAVYKDGLRLISGTDYTETNSDTVTLTTPALAGRQFMFEVGQTLAQPAPVAAASELKTATASQEEFVLTGLTYVPNTLSLSVYRNGLKLVVGQDYTETNSNTVTLTSPAALGDQLVFEAGRILTNALAGTSVGFQQAGTGAIARNMQDKVRESVSVKDFGAVGDGVADDAPAIQAAITSLGSGGRVLFGAGTYKITTTILLGKSNVVLEGNGADNARHDVSAQGTLASTKLVWAGPAGGSMLYVYSPAGALLPKQASCGARNIFFEASTAGYGIFIDSQNNGIYENLFLNKFAIAAVRLSTITGNLADARDPQRNRFINVFCEQIGANGIGFWITGDNSVHPSGRIANVSMNEFDSCDVFIENADAFVFANSDRNVFTNCRAFRAAGGSGNAVVFNGASSIGYEARSNVFIGLSTNGNVPIVGKGSPTFTVASNNNNVLLVDTTNGTPEPTLETNASIWWSSDAGVTKKFKSSQTAIANTVDLATAASNRIVNESLRVHSSTADNVRLSTPNSLNEYGISVSENANPNLHNLRISRLFTAGSSIPLTLSGTGAVVVGDFLYPVTDNAYSCGQNGNRWSSVWAANGTIQTSDKREKTNISPSVLGLDFINALNPVSYKWNIGSNKVVETDSQGEVVKVESVPGKRTHFGLIAQEVKAALPQGVDFGGWVLTNEENVNSQQALRYDQFIAPLIKAIQELSAEVAVLKSKQ